MSTSHRIQQGGDTRSRCLAGEIPCGALGSFERAAPGSPAGRGSTCIASLPASRAEARKKRFLFLKSGCAMLSIAQAKRVPNCTPAAPISQIAGNRPGPVRCTPARRSDVRREFPQDFLRQTEVETGPNAALHSMPSINQRYGARRSSFPPARGLGQERSPLIRCQIRLDRFHPTLLGGMAPRSTSGDAHAWRHATAYQIEAGARGCMVMRFTPKGLGGQRLVAAIPRSRCRGVIAPQAITPNPPAFEDRGNQIAFPTPTLIAPHKIAVSQPRKSVPRCIKRSGVGIVVHGRGGGEIRAQAPAHRKLHAYRANERPVAVMAVRGRMHDQCYDCSATKLSYTRP